MTDYRENPHGTRWATIALVGVVVTVLLACSGCGSSDGDAAELPSTTEAPTTTVVPSGPMVTEVMDVFSAIGSECVLAEGEATLNMTGGELVAEADETLEQASASERAQFNILKDALLASPKDAVMYQWICDDRSDPGPEDFDMYIGPVPLRGNILSYEREGGHVSVAVGVPSNSEVTSRLVAIGATVYEAQL